MYLFALVSTEKKTPVEIAKLANITGAEEYLHELMAE